VERLVDDADLAGRFALGGTFATLYLSPRDYHRVHSPVDGAVIASRYLPGEFWPVNPATVRTQDALFCLNERLVTVIESPTLRPGRGGEGGRDLRGTESVPPTTTGSPTPVSRRGCGPTFRRVRWSGAVSWGASRWAPP
jgi:hypothetical protein